MRSRLSRSRKQLFQSAIDVNESACGTDLDAISQHLTRALADTSGLAAVGEVVLHHVVQAVPSGMASLAVAAADGELSIVATHGYPRALVEHLRIPAGSGVIGAVHVSRMPSSCLMSPRRQVWIDIDRDIELAPSRRFRSWQAPNL